MHPQQIKEQLKLLIEEASTIDPSLAIRLNQINNWIKDVKPGTLMSKRFVLLFLQQFIRDTEIRLDIKRLTSEAERQDVYELMTPPERYWYGELFPRWLSKNDPKFHIWRKKLMSGEFNQEDEKLINLIADVIKLNGGQALQRYIIDLSMASDIIVSSIQEHIDGDWLETWGDDDDEPGYIEKLTTFLESDDVVAVKVRERLQNKSHDEIIGGLEYCLSQLTEKDRIFAAKDFLVGDVLVSGSSRGSGNNSIDEVKLLELAEDLMEKLTEILG